MQITAAQSAAPTPSHSCEWFTLHDDGVVYRLQNTGDHTAKYERVAYGCSAAVANEIAALPELLNALRFITNIMDGPTDRRGVMVDMPRAMEKARAVLAKFVSDAA